MNKKRLHFITVACAFIALITMFVVSGCVKSSAPKYTLIVTAGEGGTVNSNGGLYVKGKLISIVATPNVGYEFDGWHNGGTKISSLQTYEFDMPEGDPSLEARFTKIVIVKYDLTVTAGLGGVVNAVDGMYLAGQLVILIAVPNGGYNFAGWYDGDAEVSLSATYELYMPLHNLNLQARFDIDMTPTEGFLFEPINYMGDVVQEGSHVAYQISVGTAARDGRAAIVIPSVHKGKPVTKIADYGFCDNDSKNNYARTNLINAIIIPSSITSIGNSAFSYCSILKSITIPDGITRLSNKMFSGCTYLVSVTLPSGITEIGDYAFQNCKCLSQIALPDSVKIIGNYAFSDCYSLSSMTLPDGLTDIGEGAFLYCTSLASITIPMGVTNILNYTFDNCKSLTSVTIQTGVKKIGYSAFSDCKSLTSITIPSSVSSIAANAFHTCPSLTSITIPSSVSSIAANAFFGCTKLTIYAEATSKPTNWDYYDSSYSWNYSKCPVLWGCNIGLDNVVDANGQAYVVSFSKLSGKIENPNGETLQVPFRKGYIFEGWYENDSFTGTMHTANGIKNAPDGKYYAKWGIASGQESSSESSEIQTKIYCIFKEE